MPPNPPRAFTLVEVLVVVMIIGIAAAIVVPAMLSAATMGVQAGSRMVMSDILYAQNDAIACQATRRVVFDLTNNKYQVTDGSGVVLTTPFRGADSNSYIVDFNLDERFRGVTLAAADFSGSTTLEFDALGSPTSGGQVSISGGKQKYNVNVASLTGRVTVQAAATGP